MSGAGQEPTAPEEESEARVEERLSLIAPEIYEITRVLGNGTLRDSARLSGASVTGPAPFTARFRIDQDPNLPDGTPRRFVVAGLNAVVVPSEADFVLDTVSDLRDTANDYDIVVIANPDVLDDPGNCADSVLTQLLDHRLRQDGLTSRVVCMEDLWDEFNDGLEGPLAIEAFLRYALESWTGPPTYVLFLGDGSARVNYHLGIKRLREMMQ